MTSYNFPPAVRGVFAVLCCALALSSTAGVASAAVVPAGVTIHAQLSSADINTKNAKVGDGFTMRVVPPYPSGNYSFAGATIAGHVAAVRSSGQGRKADLKLAFDRVIFSNGQTSPVSGSILTLQTKSDNTTVRKGLGAGIGAAVGSQTVGRIIGGVAGGVVGILGGAVAGFIYASNNKANFNVGRGAAATIQTASSIEVPRAQAHQ